MKAAGWNAGAFMGSGWYPMGEALKSCPAAKQNDVFQRKNNKGEQFKNCADVSVAPSGPTPPPTPAPPTPQPAATAEPEPASEPASTGGSLECGGAEQPNSCKGKCKA